MGERIKQEHEPIIKQSHSSGKKGGNGNSNPANTETKRGRGRPRKDTTASQPTETEIIPRVVVVDLPENEKNQNVESAAQPRNEKKTEPKTKKPTPKKIGLTKENLASILKSTFEVIGSRDGFDVWTLDEKECNQIAEPLSKIVGRSSYLEKITDEYGDYIALVIALSVVIAPRIMLQLKINKDKKEQNEINKKKEQKINENRLAQNRDQRNESREVSSSDRRPPRPTSHSSENIGEELHQLIGSF